MTEVALQVPAPAKVNLALEVRGLLPGGYHELDTVFSWLDLSDRLEIEPASATALEVEDEIGRGLTVPQGEENLVLRALRLLEASQARELPTRIRLVRRIPAGGGLGGGSADAAATLVGVARAHGLALDPGDLLVLAARLGADVAFGLAGGTARGEGRGEILRPLPPPPDLPVILLVPGFPLPTPEVYAAWDRLPESRRRPAAGSALRVAAALEEGDGEALTAALANDLEPAAESIRPELADLRREMLAAGCRAARLCGSGSTLFGLLEAGADPAPVVARLQAHGHVECTRFRRSPR